MTINLTSGTAYFSIWLLGKYLSQPKEVDIVEAFLLGDVVYYEYCVCAFVVGTRYRAEALLSGCVPNLQLDYAAVEGEGPGWWWGYLNLKSTPMVVR